VLRGKGGVQQAAEGESERENVRSNPPQNRRAASVQESRAASTDGPLVARSGLNQGGTTVHAFESNQHSFHLAETGIGAVAFEQRCSRPESNVWVLEQKAAPDAGQDLEAALDSSSNFSRCGMVPSNPVWLLADPSCRLTGKLADRA